MKKQMRKLRRLGSPVRHGTQDVATDETADVEAGIARELVESDPKGWEYVNPADATEELKAKPAVEDPSPSKTRRGRAAKEE